MISFNKYLTTGDGEREGKEESSFTTGADANW